MNNTIQNLPYPLNYYGILEKQKPFIAKILSCPTYELSIFESSTPPFDFEYAENDTLKDQILARYPITIDETQFLVRDIIEIWHMRTRSGIEFARVWLRHPDSGYFNYHPTQFTFVSKGKIFALKRYTDHQNKQLKSAPPILPDGMLDAITRSIFEVLNCRNRISDLSVKLVKGLLFYGTPGCGKSMMMKYIKARLRQRTIPWVSFSSNDLNPSNLNPKMFDHPVVFFDDMDLAKLSRREFGDPSLATTLLTYLDGETTKVPVSIRIFSTNETPNMIDHAFLRPGRIDEWFEFTLPTARQIELYFDGWPADLKKLIDIPKVIELCKNMSFAEIDAIKRDMVLDILHQRTVSFSKSFDSFHLRRKNGVKTTNSSPGFHKEQKVSS